MCNYDCCKGAEHCEAYDKEFEEVQNTVNSGDTDEDYIREFVEDLKEGINIEFKDITQEEIDAGLRAFDKDGDGVVCTEDTPKERLYREITDLSEKIDKLDAYLKRRNEDGVRVIVADRLTDAQVYLLHKQLEIMNEYYNILCSRYSIFDVRRPTGAQGIVSAVEIVTE